MRSDTEVRSYWTFDAGAGWTPGREGGGLPFEAVVNNLTGEVYEAGRVISRFDNTRFITRLRPFGARVEYQF